MLEPIIFNYREQPVLLENLYQGCSCFLIGAGPSLNTLDLTKLGQRGIITASMNNVAAVKVRPNFWFSVDHPKSFCSNIWYDPFIWKFVADENIEKAFLVRDDKGKLQSANRRIFEMPGVFMYRRNKDFQAEWFLVSPTVNWGNEGSTTDAYGGKGGRSVMFVALRILFYMGIRKVFLLGVDFNMERREPYCFDQQKEESACRSNNSAYEINNRRLAELQPFFQKENFKVYNCNPTSGCTAFEYKSYEDAVAFAIRNCPANPQTKGMYN